MTTTLAIQRRLLALGIDPGPLDGVIGPTTLIAIERALSRLPGVPAPSPEMPIEGPAIPAAWLPWAHMQRIIVHWTAGAHKASGLDRGHYHLMIEADGKLVRGAHSIAANENAADGDYAAHTLGCNTQSIGVALCGMRGAQESPFEAGPEPITETQWRALPAVLAALCARYAIPVTPRTVLSHAEVQVTLGIRQHGKWDIARLPFDLSVVGARAVGDRFREATAALL